MAKILGIDYGMKRVGVAISDESGRVAFPKAVYPNNKFLSTEIIALIKAHTIAEVVIGESKNNSGEENSVARSARAFAEGIERKTGVTIHYEPEFYSSQEVRTHTKPEEGGRSKVPPPSHMVDAAAAAVILNSFLTKRYGTHD